MLLRTPCCAEVGMEAKKIYRALVGFDPTTLTPKLNGGDDNNTGICLLHEDNYERMRENFDGEVVSGGKWLWIYAEVEV